MVAETESIVMAGQVLLKVLSKKRGRPKPEIGRSCRQKEDGRFHSKIFGTLEATKQRKEEILCSNSQTWKKKNCSTERKIKDLEKKTHGFFEKVFSCERNLREGKRFLEKGREKFFNYRNCETRLEPKSLFLPTFLLRLPSEKVFQIFKKEELWSMWKVFQEAKKVWQVFWWGGEFAQKLTFSSCQMKLLKLWFKCFPFVLYSH